MPRCLLNGMRRTLARSAWESAQGAWPNNAGRRHNPCHWLKRRRLAWFPRHTASWSEGAGGAAAQKSTARLPPCARRELKSLVCPATWFESQNVRRTHCNELPFYDRRANIIRGLGTNCRTCAAPPLDAWEIGLANDLQNTASQTQRGKICRRKQYLI